MEENPFVRFWRSRPPGRGALRSGGQEAAIIVDSPDYDGKGKLLVRFRDGREAIVGGSRVIRRARIQYFRMGSEISHACRLIGRGMLFGIPNASTWIRIAEPPVRRRLDANSKVDELSARPSSQSTLRNCERDHETD